MKQVILSLVVCISLAGCETMPTMSDVNEYNWAKLNPFAEKEPVQKVEFKDVAAQSSPSAPNKNALETELQEIEMLTGSKPVVSAQNFEKTPITEIVSDNIETIENNINPVFETAVIPQAKPNAATAQPTKTESNVEITTITDADPATAAPQTAVVSQPTKDSIKWHTPSQPKINKNVASTQAVAIAPPPAPTQSFQPQPTISAPNDQVSAVKSLSVTLNQPKNIKGCPQLQIMPSAMSITNFEDNASGQMTSRASIVDVRGGCEAINGGMEIDLDIIMKGLVTNKGRFEGNTQLEAFITFPYFVSVTSPAGDPLDKQIMATAFRFKPIINDLDHAEKITQFIPMSDMTKAEQYLVTVGFQLSRKQLEYNKAETVMRVNDTRVSPDTSPARKKSYNPLSN